MRTAAADLSACSLTVTDCTRALNPFEKARLRCVKFTRSHVPDLLSRNENSHYSVAKLSKDLAGD